MDGTVEVRPEWKDLLDRVRQGETLTLTEGGRVVARLVPQGGLRREGRSEQEIAARVAAFQDFASRHALGGVPIRDLIDEGKR